MNDEDDDYDEELINVFSKYAKQSQSEKFDDYVTRDVNESDSEQKNKNSNHKLSKQNKQASKKNKKDESKQTSSILSVFTNKLTEMFDNQQKMNESFQKI